MKLLNREQVLNSNDLKEKEIECPEWGGSVKIKALSLTKRNGVMKGAEDNNGKIDFEKLQVLTFIECVIEPKFTIADYIALSNKSHTAMDRVVQAVYELSGISVSKEGKEEAKKN